MILRPDGTLGAVLASESLGLTDTLVNGAGGCRSRTQIMLRDLMSTYKEEDTRCCGSRFFSRQSRLPCTYINGDDIVFGTGCKVSEGISSVSSITGKPTSVVETLGASLVCTDYAQISGNGVEVIPLDADLSSMSFEEGYDFAMGRILSYLLPDDGERTFEPSVNLLGYGIHDLGWEFGLDDLKALLSNMGVKVLAAIGCMPSEDEVIASTGAWLNIMVHPESCTGTARMYERNHDIPFLRPKDGAPVGYDSIRSMLKQVGEALGIDPTPALCAVDSEASKVLGMLRNYNKGVNMLRGRMYSIEASSSELYPLMVWMHDVFAMVPDSIIPLDPEYLSEIATYLESIGKADSLMSPRHGVDDIVFTDGVDCAYGKAEGGVTSYVEVRPPNMRGLNLVGRCTVGTGGCRYLIDEMLNGINRFRCGQPSSIDMR